MLQHVYPLFLLLLVLILSTGQDVISPTKTKTTKVEAPEPKITCGTCRTSTSITLDWIHNRFAEAPADYYNVYWRTKKEDSPEAWNRETVRTWKDVTVQVTIGCCTGCETDMQLECGKKNLKSSTVYEIVAESVYFNERALGGGANETNPSAPLEIATGQDATLMPRSVLNPNSLNSPLETLCSFLGVSKKAN